MDVDDLRAALRDALDNELPDDSAVYLSDVWAGVVEAALALFDTDAAGPIASRGVATLVSCLVPTEDRAALLTDVETGADLEERLREIRPLDGLRELVGPASIGGSASYSPASSAEIDSFTWNGHVFLVWDEGDGEELARAAFRVDDSDEIRRGWEEKVDQFLWPDDEEERLFPPDWWDD